MSVYKIIKELYLKDKETNTSLTLFAIVGITLFLLSSILIYLDNIYFFNHIIRFPSNNFVLSNLIFAVGIIFLCYLTNYNYKTIKNKLKTNSNTLPDVDSKELSIFFRVLPIEFVWMIYKVLYCLLLLILYFQNMIYFYIALVIGLIIFPFSQYIIIDFLNDLKYHFAYFSPLGMIKYIKRNFIPTIYLVIFVIGFMTSFLLILLTIMKVITIEYNNLYVIFAINLLCSSVFAFILYIFKLIYSLGLTELYLKVK